MIITTVRLERPEGTVLARGIAVQIDQVGDMESWDFNDARAFDRVMVYTLQGVPLTQIQRRDVLFDEVNTDPETGALAKYRVSGAVETFQYDHQEALCERVVGS